MDLFFSALFSGLITGGYYALIGIGLALVFGAMHIVNLAHGEVIMVAAVATYVGYSELGWPLVTAIALGVGISAVVGALTYGLLFPIRNAPPLNGMVLTYGVAIMLIYGVLELYGANPRSIAYTPFVRGVGLGPLRVSMGELVVFGVSLLAVGGVWLFVNRTWMGRAVRAVSQNRLAASSLGINPFRIDAVTFILGAALAGLGGALIITVQTVTPVAAPLFTVKAFVIVVLAGLASTTGVLVAGFILGVAEALTGAFFNPALTELVAFALFLAILLFRPEGLLGRRG